MNYFEVKLEKVLFIVSKKIKMASAREDNHWFKIEHKLNGVKDAWDDVVDQEDDDYFSFGGKLKGTVEKVCNASLILAGPMIETYIKELGSLILNKLSRFTSSSLANAANQFGT